MVKVYLVYLDIDEADAAFAERDVAEAYAASRCGYVEERELLTAAPVCKKRYRADISSKGTTVTEFVVWSHSADFGKIGTGWARKRGEWAACGISEVSYDDAVAVARQLLQVAREAQK